jgi:hypothetical protein
MDISREDGSRKWHECGSRAQSYRFGYDIRHAYLTAVLWYRITDAGKSVIAVSEAASAVYQLALTGLRNIIGQHDLDEVLQERDKINDLLRQSIMGSTTQWGIEVERFEMKDVELPEAMQQVMAMQAEAIREKRARIIKAEADFVTLSTSLSDYLRTRSPKKD